MDRASSLIFPGSRTLAGWWRQLSPFQPLALAIGYAFLHRIEAPVVTLSEEPIDALTHLVLQALTLEEAGSIRLTDLHERMRLPAAVLQRVVAGMQGEGLLDPVKPDRWQMTERGQHALQNRWIPKRGPQRRVFPFAECMDPAGQRLGPPAFVPIAECVGVPWPVNDVHRFEIADLRRCI